MALATVSGNENYTMCIQDIAIGDQGIFDKISQVKCTVIAADASARDLQPTNLFKIEGKWKADLGIKLSPNVTLKMQIYRLFLPVFSRHPNSAVTQLQGTDIHRWLHALPTSKKEGRHDMPWTLDLGPGRKKLNILIGLDVVINPPIRTPSSLLSEKHENELLDKLGNRNQPPGLLLADHTLQKGTRRKQLLHISEWIKGRAETQSNVLLLVGALGTGKTCIVSKVWTELKKDKTRSSALLCLTDDRAKNLDRVSNNLALVIADAYPAFRTSLCRILDSSFTSTHSGIPEVLEKILTAFASIPLEEQIPLVVIVDATANFYDPHFPKIVESWAELPSCFKLLVTARPHEGSSQAVAEKKAEYLELHSGAGRSDEDDSDIAIFLEDKLSQLAPKKYASVAEPWPGKHIISKLVQDSAGLFSWAYAIVSSIGATHDQDRDEQLAKVVLDSTSAKYCDESFGDILDSIFPFGFEDVHRIVGAISISKGTLPSPILKTLLPSSSQLTLSLEDSLQKLLPVVYLNEDASLVDLRHPSFSSYVTDQGNKRCQFKFAINRAQSNGDLAQVCLRILDQLEFDVCRLKPSHSTDIWPLIAPDLAYASRFWADHVRSTSTQAPRMHDLETSFKPAHEKRNDKLKANEGGSRNHWGTELFALVKTFFEDAKWLYWLEVMSALGHVDATPRLLATVAEWLEYNGNKELSSLAMDISRFVSTFRDAIASSPSHIYHSALRFCPPSFLLYKRLQSNLSNHCSISESCFVGDHVPRFPRFPLQFSFLASDNSKPFRAQSNESVRAVTRLALSADGRRVAAKVCWHSESADSAIHVLSITTGTLVTTLLVGDGDGVLALVFSGDQVVTGSTDGGIRIWDSNTGVQLGRTFRAHTDWIRGIAISPDTRSSLAVSCSDDNTLRIVKFTANNAISSTIAPLRGHHGHVRSVTWTPDGKYIVSGGDDGTVRVWDKSSGLPDGELMASHYGSVLVVAVDSSGRYVASGGIFDQNIQLWSLDTRTRTHSFSCYDAIGIVRVTEPSALVFSKDGRRLFSGYGDGRILSWEVSSGQPTAGQIVEYANGHPDSMNSLCLLSDSRMLSAGGEDGFIKVWDISPPGPEEKPPAFGPFFLAHCMPDGETIILTDGHQYCGWNTETHSSHGGSPFVDTDPISGPRSINISPDGRFAAIGTSRGARVYDMSPDGGRLPYSFGDEATGDVAFSTDGQSLVIVTSDLTLSVWDTAKGTPPKVIMQGLHTDYISSVVFNPDGTLVASCSYDKSVCIWDVKTGSAIHEHMEGHTSEVTCVDFSPDGQYLASVDNDTVIIWNVRNGGQSYSWPVMDPDNILLWVAWSPDSQWVALATGGNLPTIHVLAIMTGKPVVAPLRGHSARINDIKFLSHPDGLRIVSTARDRTARIWDVGPEVQSRMDSEGDSELWLNTDGWVYKGGSKDKISWVPPPLRKGVCLPPQIAVFGAPKIQVDLQTWYTGRIG